MMKTRIALALGATAITGAAIYATDQYLADAPLGSDAPVLAVDDQLAEEARATDCGLRDASTGSRDADYIALAENVTRSRVIAADAIPADANIAELVEQGDCRLRLDGVWVEDLPLALDKSVTPTAFTDFDNRLGDPDLMHTTYLMPAAMLIDASEDGQTLTIRDGRGSGEAIVAQAQDEALLADVFTNVGTVKLYQAEGSEPGDPAGLIEVDMPVPGTIRIRIAGKNFYRPQPKVSEATDLSSVNPFMIGFNMQNLRATRKGYDIVTQDMWELGENNAKGDIFAEADPSQYAITEQRTVPIGHKLMPETIAGTLVTSRLMRSQRDFQRTVSWNAGGKVGGAINPLSGQPANAVGVSYAQSEASGMSSGQANSIMHGLTRQKVFTMILDEPFARLSTEFVIAVNDAYRHGRYEELIERFGTHYPYAIAYGSAGLAVTEFSEETVSNWQAKSQSVDANAKAAIKGVNVEMSGGVAIDQSESETFLSQASYEDWRTVGGTGSFSKEGHATGTPAPILADLRPLHELLNPLNFPGEPAIYTEVREELRQAIDAYLTESAAQLSAKRAQMNRKFRVTPTRIACTRTRKEKRLDIYGDIFLQARFPGGSDTSDVAGWQDKAGKRFKLDCEKRTKDWANLPDRARSQVINQHPDSLDKVSLRFRANLKDNDANTDDVLLSNRSSEAIRLDATMPVCGTEQVRVGFKRDDSKVYEFFIEAQVQRLPLSGKCDGSEWIRA